MGHLYERGLWNTCEWEGDTELYLSKNAYEGGEWIQLAENSVQWRAVLNTVVIRLIV